MDNKRTSTSVTNNNKAIRKTTMLYGPFTFKSLKILKGPGNRKPQVDKGQAIQWSKKKGQRDNTDLQTATQKTKG